MAPSTAQLESHVIETSPASTPATAPLVEAMVHLLNELAGVISGLTDEQYTASPVGVMPSSIAAHVRHGLDHIRAAIHFQPGRPLDYDQRQRGTGVELHRAGALAEVSRLIADLLSLEGVSMHRPLRLSILPSPNGAAAIVETSVGRELAYVLSHTIHHNALIGAMVNTLGGTVPPHFGWAPSTIRYMEQMRCAR